MLDLIAASDSPVRGVQVRVHGGAIARVAEDATAFAHRHEPINIPPAAG